MSKIRAGALWRSKHNKSLIQITHAAKPSDYPSWVFYRYIGAGIYGTPTPIEDWKLRNHFEEVETGDPI